jgi:indolepyruvate ferredoxin oxidoreductase alpha subunit
MTRYAFDLSEKFKVPVMLRLVTRLAHSRAQLELKPPKAKVQLGKTTAPKDWILMPANSRRRWNERLEQWPEIEKLSENSSYNPLTLNSKRLGVITTGLALNYYLENAEELTSEKPSHLHIGLYPFPQEKVRKLLAHCEEVIIIEDGYPFVERFVRGVVEPKTKLRGKLDKFIPPAGELTPEIVRKALGLKIHDSVKTPAGLNLPGRPPQLCQGCPHCDSYASLKKALEAVGATPDKSMVTGDIGCYTLGALPPYSAIQSCICMGGSISMAKGAADAGLHPVVAMIGDSTFLHSGIQPLIDATAANTPMTVMILDNAAVAMTGGQQTALPSSRLREIVAGIGVSPDHLHVLDAHRMKIDANAEIIKKELEHKGLSVIITYRECLETAKRKKK